MDKQSDICIHTDDLQVMGDTKTWPTLQSDPYPRIHSIISSNTFSGTRYHEVTVITVF